MKEEKKLSKDKAAEKLHKAPFLTEMAGGKNSSIEKLRRELNENGSKKQIKLVEAIVEEMNRKKNRKMPPDLAEKMWEKMIEERRNSIVPEGTEKIIYVSSEKKEKKVGQKDP